jgi:hypothetical protein
METSCSTTLGSSVTRKEWFEDSSSEEEEARPIRVRLLKKGEETGI